MVNDIDDISHKWAALRAPFPPSCIGKKPQPTKKDAQKGKCHECGGWHGLPAIHLDYVGHAAVTERLLQVDPAWTWEPLAIGPNGMPVVDEFGGMWIRLTVLGVTRIGYGNGDRDGADGLKSTISDAIRNAAMRFGVALDLWSKEDLSEMRGHAESEPVAPAKAPTPPVAPATAKPIAAVDDHAERLKAAGAILPTLVGKDAATMVWNAFPDRAQRLVAITTANADAQHVLDVMGGRGEELITDLSRAHAGDAHAFLAALNKAALGEVSRG